MKKIYFFCIIVLVLSSKGISWAQDSLPKIRIGDISIYESADSIVGEGIQGYVSYDAVTNTLFLDNAALPSLWACMTEGYFKVRLSGNNSIANMKTSNDSCTFFGPGTLNLGGVTVEIALDCSRTDYLALTEGAALNITASGTGIFTLYDYTMDTDLHYPLLVVDNSSLVVAAPTCCTSMWAWWLSECQVVAPADFDYQLDTWFSPEPGMVYNYLEIRAGTVGIPTHANIDWHAWGVDGGIRVEGLPDNQAIEVVNILGQTVRNATSSATDTFIPLKTGLYLVRINGKTAKIVVK